MTRALVWYSDGAASAVAAKLAVAKYGSACEVLKCETTVSEHPDNLRFRLDIESDGDIECGPFCVMEPADG